ncbi:hypothetical protein BX616_006431 [Lobosporangium transversale]|uniref:RlpA-like protein double-psi beta-barrel domain-containing protein n=1 Tax=Lobosporangium transversale TaxID=64571 RepID=A0A1Y2H1Z9_9FUNG|nr:hypothetical protein BCR41DRAFT_417746 [Lobosporangium transversale]KAF9915313.1 hypothetical protein BX616_006431 [Lobosporangium transversale]ORZ28599.1 hypothetical protein BCR41DRAFT_417746 [Lobosporangium transversale]|eukprot:XP_021886272.1 hypothetical protein BCR41DRAFT_417746 [Lobosporangium transversale]
MAPIPRLAAGPLSIITGALIGAFSSPNSTPPSDGTNATVWGTEYRGSASFLNLTLESTPVSSPTSTTSSSSLPSPTTPTSGPSSPTSPSLVFFGDKPDTFIGCNNRTFISSDNVALMNPLQFGDISSQNTTCGEWIQIQNRENNEQSTLAQIAGVCDDCEYGSVSLSLGALEELVISKLPWDQIKFDPTAELTIANLTDPMQPLPAATTVISPKNLAKISWKLTDAPAPKVPAAISSAPTPTATSTSTTTTSTKKAEEPKPTKPAPSPAPSKKPDPPAPKPSGKQFTGRATWYSDTFGQCEESYSQSDLIVAVNEAQMGRGKDLCGKKLLVTAKGSDVQVVVKVVDMCPSEHCDFGALDLSQAAFKKFADLNVGVLQLTWSFL